MHAALLFSCMLLLTLRVAGGPLDDLQSNFETRCDFAAADRDLQLKKLDASYLAALDRQVEKIKATGKLDAVIPYINEIQAVKNAARAAGLAPPPPPSGESQAQDPARSDRPLPSDRNTETPGGNAATETPLPAGASLELQQMRAKHAEARAKILKSHAEALASLADKMVAALKSRETEFTKAGKFDDALAAKKMRETLEKDQTIGDARDLMRFGGASNLGRPAMQIRRFGDNLEVLVHYDRSGKISMDSPVSNIRERTEPGRELGDTKATTLGEFVGAKGYKVDPYVAFHQIFDKAEAPGMIFAEIVPTYKTAIDGETGMALAFQPAAKNPHINLGGLLPTTTTGGSARIHARYLVPRQNQALQGFTFIQYVGAPLAGKRFASQGSWTDETIEFEAAHEMPGLLLYLTLFEGKTVPDATGESVLLRELRIEHSVFSAFLQKRIDPSGKPIDDITDAAKQPQIIRNGILIEGRAAPPGPPRE
jgi:hypothetical protein